MIRKYTAAAGIFLLLLFTIQPGSGKAGLADTWQSLFDKGLTNFDIFIGVPEAGVVVPGYSEENRLKKVPLGLNNDPLHVFKMEEEKGQPVLHVSGQMLGGLSTKKEYQNYHLKIKVKWGEAKFAPRLKDLRDNGILYHATGPHGKFWNVWMRAHEMQVQETDMGDYYGLAGVVMNVKSKKFDNSLFIFSPEGESKAFMEVKGFTNRCKRSADYERPHGEWNDLELICFEDKSLHIVNGHVVMALQDSRIRIGEGDEPSLQRGKIQLQSEYAEAYYKDMQIQPVKALSKEYAKFFQ